jgi:putative membrane protein
VNHRHPATSVETIDVGALPWIAVLVLLGAGYAWCRWRQPNTKSWDYRRSWSWYGGVVVAGLALVGPVADASHASFIAHMWGHLLLGMLAPILLVMGAPVTLVLRAVPTRHARDIVRVLGSLPLRVLAHPVTASVLNIGGLVVLYRTDLYQVMHTMWWVSLLVHGHFLAAGYLFTAAMIGIDPVQHRPSHLSRAVVLVLALGAHAMLAKSFSMDPPGGVSIDQAQAGSHIMYYGGDAVDILLIGIFCWQWYQATAPRANRVGALGHEQSP